MLDYIQKLKKSGLAPNQLIHSIKTFIIPKLHYASSNNNIKIGSLKKVDDEIRKVINEILEVLHYH
jgi:hypothetical protein